MAIEAVVEELAHLGPDEVPALADRLADSDNVASILSLMQQLARRVSSRPLERFTEVWGLSSNEAARVFGVSRQAYAKWLRSGVPTDRQVDVRLVDSATARLVDHVKVERIPAVVRRPVEDLGDRSLLDVALAGELELLDTYTGTLFDLHRVQP